MSERVYKMETSTFIDFIKVRWQVIVILIAVICIIILVLLFVAGLLLLPAEVTQSCGVVTYYANNSTG